MPSGVLMCLGVWECGRYIGAVIFGRGANNHRIAPLAKPYPKRATSVDSDAPEVHSGEGGAIPTVALQPCQPGVM
jgi:hypothetical protein